MIIKIDTAAQAVTHVNKWLPGEDIPKLLEYKENLVGIEIGVDCGVTSEHLLSSLPTLKLFGIDPYMDYVDWSNVLVTGQESNAFPVMMEKTSKFDKRFVLIREKSDDAINVFEDESMDFIFVDGIHTYDQVLKDCRNYWPKLKRNGLFCGHDFTNIQQVNQAVNEFAQEIGYQISRANQDIWYWFKK
jgi:Methyltransferase domain